MKKRKNFTRPVILAGEAVSQMDPLNRQFFEWDELKRLPEKRRGKPSQ